MSDTDFIFKDIENAEDFLRGQRDCKNGVGHKSNMSSDYDRGYSIQYDLEQVVSWVTER